MRIGKRRVLTAMVNTLRFHRAGRGPAPQKLIARRDALPIARAGEMWYAGGIFQARPAGRQKRWGTQ
jgi:hypothetical protein